VSSISLHLNRRPLRALLGLCLSGVVSPHVAAQTTDSTRPALSQAVSDLPSGLTIRLATREGRWSGRLEATSADSLTLSDERGTRTLRMAAIDSLWVRGRKSHNGLLAGAGFGALMFGVLWLGARSSEDRWITARLGTAIFAGALAAGVAVDAVSDPWVQRYPAEP
jgi:hypothetical protein